MRLPEDSRGAYFQIQNALIRNTKFKEICNSEIQDIPQNYSI